MAGAKALETLWVGEEEVREVAGTVGCAAWEVVWAATEVACETVWVTAEAVGNPLARAGAVAGVEV